FQRCRRLFEQPATPLSCGEQTKLSDSVSRSLRAALVKIQTQLSTANRVCSPALKENEMTFAPRMHLLRVSVQIAVIFIVSLLCVDIARGQAQANAADLNGYVRDPQGAVVVGATVTARNPATNFTRSVTTNGEGYYQITSLPPGDYEITVEAPNYKKTVVPTYTLTVGARADLDVAMEVGQISETVNISSEDQPVVETTRTTVANTIEQQRIENLPINQRDYLGFATTISTVNRGNDRPIGPAPSSGLNIGGQRGRSTLVQV